MTGPACPECASSEVGTTQAQTFCGVVESNACDDCDATWPVGIWSGGVLR
jgi:hypothetical protein